MISDNVTKWGSVHGHPGRAGRWQAGGRVPESVDSRRSRGSTSWSACSRAAAASSCVRPRRSSCCRMRRAKSLACWRTAPRASCASGRRPWCIATSGYMNNAQLMMAHVTRYFGMCSQRNASYWDRKPPFNRRRPVHGAGDWGAAVHRRMGRLLRPHAAGAAREDHEPDGQLVLLLLAVLHRGEQVRQALLRRGHGPVHGPAELHRRRAELRPGSLAAAGCDGGLRLRRSGLQDVRVRELRSGRSWTSTSRTSWPARPWRWRTRFPSWPSRWKRGTSGCRPTTSCTTSPSTTTRRPTARRGRCRFRRRTCGRRWSTTIRRTTRFWGRPGITSMHGGVRVDENAQLLHRSGKPIPGLFAAGNVIGNFNNIQYNGNICMGAGAGHGGRRPGGQDADAEGRVRRRGGLGNLVQHTASLKAARVNASALPFSFFT